MPKYISFTPKRTGRPVTIPRKYIAGITPTFVANETLEHNAASVTLTEKGREKLSNTVLAEAFTNNSAGSLSQSDHTVLESYSDLNAQLTGRKNTLG